MYISKKDLLAMTGISYGQLYRWKRERLIPEEWFIKQASFTGQETFFPREQILSRIRSILELKDRYSLDELAKMLSPEVSKTTYSKVDLEVLQELNPELWKLFDKVFQRDTYEYVEVLMMLLASEIKQQLNLDEDEIQQFMRTILSANLSAKLIEMSVNSVQIQEKLYTILVKEDQIAYFDDRMKVVYERKLRELSNEVKIKYQDKFR
jgi:DNA-binding transcriptional MerR regulator